MKRKTGTAFEIRFDEAFQQVTLYDSWVQRGIARHRQGFERVDLLLHSELQKGPSEAVRESINKRRAMIENYHSLANAGQLTDMHIFTIGEEYLGDVIGNGLLYQKDSDLQARYAYENAPERRMRARNDRTDPNYYNGTVKAFLEGLSGKDLSLDAHESASDIAWTSEAERFFITKAIKKTSASYASNAVKAASEKFTLGLYDGFASATGGADIYLILTGRDHMHNRRQPFWMRLNAAIGLGSSTLLSISGSRAAQAFLPDMSISRRTLGKAAKTDNAIMAHGFHNVTSGKKLDDIVDYPASLSDAQKRKTNFEMADPPGNADRNGPNCGSRLSREDVNRIARNLENMSLEEFNDYLRREDYISKYYPEGTHIVDPFGDKIMDTQVGPACNAMSTNYGLLKGGEYQDQSKKRSQNYRAAFD